jgi:hypothetical protein
LQIVWPTAAAAVCPNATVALRAEAHIAAAASLVNLVNLVNLDNLAAALLADARDHAVAVAARADDPIVAVA